MTDADGHYRISIRNLILSCRIGVRPEEKTADQRVRVTVVLDAARPSGFDDDLARAVDYSRLTAGIRALSGAGHVYLLETMAEKILDLAWTDERVRHARVRVEKLDVYADAESVGVELDRRRVGSRAAAAGHGEGR